MRFIIMHTSNAHWEAGGIPTPELIAKVGGMIGELAKANVLHSGEGLRATSEGARLRVSGGKRTVTKGPFQGMNELPAAFTIVRTASLDEAVALASREAEILGDVEIDVRPVTEPWDIGMMPKPEGLTTRRYMLLRKATEESEAGRSPTDAQKASLARLAAEAPRGTHLASETMRPSARGRRYKNTEGGLRVIDGPFAESKELLAGYVIVSVPSLDEASRIAERYLECVETDEVDVRELVG